MTYESVGKRRRILLDKQAT